MESVIFLLSCLSEFVLEVISLLVFCVDLILWLLSINDSKFSFSYEMISKVEQNLKTRMGF